MTTIQNLPKETLDLILEKLERQDLQQYQKVCRSFYSPAHAMLLRDIRLFGFTKIKQFITSIDHHDNPSYLNTVKRITLISVTVEEHVLCKQDIKKLFFRFPNLQQVLLANTLKWFKEFNDDICREFLLCCPKLDKFEELEGSSVDYRTIMKLRLLWTFINFRPIFFPNAHTGSAAQMIKQFPRLRSVAINSNELNNFEKWLPVLQKLPNFKSFNLWCAREDRPGFAENYLDTLTKQHQDDLLKTLSQIVSLQMSSFSRLTSCSVEFVAKYMTNLNTIDLEASFERHWDTELQLNFCNNILDLLECGKRNRHVQFGRMTTDTVANCFPLVLDRVFGNSSKQNRRLCISNRSSDSWALGVEVSEEKDVRLLINDQMDARGYIESLFGQDGQIIPRYDIDELEMNIYAGVNELYNLDIDINMYLMFLQRMPLLKKVKLEIPPKYYEKETAFNVMLPKVKELAIRADHGRPIQTLLDTLAVTFPNLSVLELCNSCGIARDIDKSLPSKIGLRLPLPYYSLKTLIIDVTPVLTKWVHPLIANETCLLVDVESLLDHKRQFYKVATDLSTVTSIQDPSDLQDSKFRLSLHITINSVKGIKLYRCSRNVVVKDGKSIYISVQ